MKNIIVPIDFSDESLKGLQVAVLFSKKQNTNIQLVYVKKKSNDYRPVSFEEERKFAEKKMEQIIEETKPSLGNDSTLEFIIKKGKIYQEIVSQAESVKDPLIVMSTHGASGFEELFIGSNAFKLLSATEIPVITINKGECPKEINRIVMPIDVSPKSRQKVSYTAEMARLFGAEIHVVSVTSSEGRRINHKVKAYSNQVAGYLQSLKLPVILDSIKGDALTDIIIEYAVKVNAELISTMKDTSSSFNFLSGNYTHDLVNKAPMLTLNVTPKVLGYAGSFSTFGG